MIVHSSVAWVSIEEGLPFTGAAEYKQLNSSSNSDFILCSVSALNPVAGGEFTAVLSYSTVLDEAKEASLAVGCNPHSLNCCLR